MSLNVLASLAIDSDDTTNYWEMIDEEIAREIRRDENSGLIPADPELRDRLRKEAFLIEVEGDEIHIAIDEDRYVNVVAEMAW